jgi:hypothetical protein
MRDLSDIVICRPGGIARAGLALVATAVLMTALQPGTAQGRDAGRDPKAAESAGPVFARIASAFEDSDAAALAALVHGEGLRVTGHNERAGEYSPAQAVYFFRNLFQAQRTLVFAFRKTQDDAAGGFARGMADWKRRRIDSETVVEQQIVLRLARDDGQWRLVEINLIR